MFSVEVFLSTMKAVTWMNPPFPLVLYFFLIVVVGIKECNVGFFCALFVVFFFYLSRPSIKSENPSSLRGKTRHPGKFLIKKVIRAGGGLSDGLSFCVTVDLPSSQKGNSDRHGDDICVPASPRKIWSLQS